MRGTPKPRRPPVGRRGVAVLLATIGVIAILSIVLLPAQRSRAHSDNTLSQGACSDCHPSPKSTFLTVTNLPTSTYTPGGVYTLTISIADTNGVGRNGFDLTVSAGTLSSSDPNVSVLPNNTEAHTLVDTVSSWTIVWTAPSSGDVKIETWAVYGFGSRATSPWNHDVRTLGTAAIPEFPSILLPVIGLAGALIVMSKVHKKGPQKT